MNSGVNGAVLAVNNTNSAGTSVKGLSIYVPTGRAPITVNPLAGKATNLNADLLDGQDASAFARGTNVTVLANRVVLDNGELFVNLLTLPGLGVLKGQCSSGDPATYITWENTTPGVIDLWRNNFPDGQMRAQLAPATLNIGVADWAQIGDAHQNGDTLVLGNGNDPGPRRTATVTLAAYRSAAGAPCGLQATATIWSAP